MVTTRVRAVSTAAALVVVLAVVLGACGSSSSGTTEAIGSATSAPAAAAPDAASADGSGSEPAAAPWQTIEIVDVDGQTFTLSELAGRPVFVENFATWCPTCRAQLGRTQEAAAAMGDDAVFVVLSVETDLSAEDVREYARDNGFTSMRFAVMSDELLAAFAGAFGTSAVNPPSTPHVVIAADGTAGEMETGSISAADIEEALRAAA
jgi:thiol-disulfide isomerase/thioredoxin